MSDALHHARIEHACEVMHDAYEKAAIGAGWETQQASRKPWADVPEANKATMRVAVAALWQEVVQPEIAQAARIADGKWVDLIGNALALNNGDIDTAEFRRRNRVNAASDPEQGQCSLCGRWYPKPVEYHHTAEECA